MFEPVEVLNTPTACYPNKRIARALLLADFFNISGDIIIGFVNNKPGAHLAFVIQNVSKRFDSRSFEGERFIRCLIHVNTLELVSAVIG